MGECREAFLAQCLKWWPESKVAWPDNSTPILFGPGTKDGMSLRRDWFAWQAAWNSRAPSKAERDGVLAVLDMVDTLELQGETMVSIERIQALVSPLRIIREELDRAGRGEK